MRARGLVIILMIQSVWQVSQLLVCRDKLVTTALWSTRSGLRFVGYNGLRQRLVCFGFGVLHGQRSACSGRLVWQSAVE